MLLEVKVPEAGFSVTEGTVLEWQKKVGDAVQQGDILVAIETDKVSMEIPASASGIMKEIRFQTGQVAPVGGVLALIDTGGAAAAGSPAAAEPVKPSTAPVATAPLATATASVSRPGAGVKGKKISPLAKAIARKHGLDLALVPLGSGPEGRIVRDDVLRLLGPVKGAPSSGAVVAQITAGQKTPFTGWRKIIADRMVSSVRSIPHYTMSVEIDVTNLAALIEESRREGKGPKLTYLPFMMKAIGLGIAAVPEVNAHCWEDGYCIQPAVNIGIAVDLGEKLLVPVLRDVTEKSVKTLAVEIMDLVQKAREERLQPRDIEGGTITLTNVGVYNIHSGTSIIMQPQVAIVYIGVVREVPVVVNGSVGVRKVMIAGGTFDHRLVNGGPGARFLDTIKGSLENLNRFVLELR
jgi:pyruvate dehydrogenase E2 component (dihydrolipoamide acetyltransferase)